MGKDFVRDFREAREVFEEADEALGFPLSRLCFEGPTEDLALTENTQPAVLATSLAILRVVESMGKRADIVAGHSLGEYSAIVCAGGMGFSDAMRVVRLRGRFMQEAVPFGLGAMAAILGLGDEQVREICREAAEGETLSPANFNAPGQVVVSGHTAAVDRACRLARERGAKRVLTLSVSAPFHCALMESARERLAQTLQPVRFRDLQVPLINNADASRITTATEVKASLIRQVTAPVRWNESIRKLIRLGVENAFEIGPGRVLTGLIRGIDRSIRTGPVGTIAQVEQYV